MKRHPGLMTTTSPSALDAFDEFSHLRVVEWDNRPADVKLRNKENDAALLEFAKKAPLKENTIKNPVVRYTIDGTLANYTQSTASAVYDATTLDVEDPSITAKAHTLIVVATGEELDIASISGNTLTIVRGNHGPSFAIPANAELRPGAPIIGETGKLKDAHTSYPGDPSYNFITLMGYKFEMSTMQINAAMEGDWGTWDKYSMDTKYQVEYSQQNALIFQHRGSDSTSAIGGVAANTAGESMVYRGSGLMEQLSGNVLDLGDTGTNFLWENMNDFVNPMFASELSSDTKDVFCGHSLWADMLTTSRQAGSMEGEIGINADYGSNMFTFFTTEGKRVNCHNVGGMDGEMARLGFVLDASNIGGSQYEGLGPQWFLDLQANDEILKREAGYFTSWETHIYDRTTMGMIRGGTQPLIV